VPVYKVEIMLISITEEFAANIYWALNQDPSPLSEELRYTLSWDAANERCISQSLLPFYKTIHFISFFSKVNCLNFQIFAIF
jgi:hypothetical protein